jgi:hypothetical protein
VPPATFIEPTLARAVSHLPSGDAWQYELKLDGYRAVVVKHSGAVTLYSRNRKKFNVLLPRLGRTRPAGFPPRLCASGTAGGLKEVQRCSGGIYRGMMNATGMITNLVQSLATNASARDPVELLQQIAHKLTNATANQARETMETKKSSSA